MLDSKAPANKRLRRGAVIRVQTDEKNNWRIVQMPEVEAALLAADPQTGAIRALVGGFDFSRNKFNHVTQAWRQPGSSFKPFIYSAALEKGLTPASIVNDEPDQHPGFGHRLQAWELKNYDGKFEGPMRVRNARQPEEHGLGPPAPGQWRAFRAGLRDALRLRRRKASTVLTMALGAGAVTPWQMVWPSAAFANGGYRIPPFIVRDIQDDKGTILGSGTTHPGRRRRPARH